MQISSLREEWESIWDIEPPVTIGRAMLTKSIEYKWMESSISLENKKHLEQIVNNHINSVKSNICKRTLKSGTQLIRTYKGIKYIIHVKDDGFEYQNKTYKSLSKIANEITGSKWNGWVFFGLK